MRRKINKFGIIPVLAVCINIMFSYTVCATTTDYIFWNTDKYVTSGKFSQTEVKKEANRYADGQIKDYINAYLANYPLYKKTSGSAITSDGYVNASVDIYEKDSSKPLVSARNINFQLGQGILPDDVENLLYGTSAGAKRTYSFTSDECIERYGVPSVKYDIKINAIIEPEYITYDNLTDTFAQKISFASSADLINTLQLEAAKNLDNYRKNAVYKAVSPYYSVNIPDYLVRQEANEYKELMIRREFGGDRSRYKNYINEAYESESEFDDQLQSQFDETIERDLILTRVAKDIGVETFGKSYDNNMLSLAQSYGYGSKDEMFEAFSTSYESGQDYINRQYLIASAIYSLCDYEISAVEDKKEDLALEIRGDNSGLIYSVPSTRGFKSYMDYRTITARTSKQFALQQYAQTAYNGLRTVNGRYCIALGTYFGGQIGQYCDITLNNGTVIECILGDIKADVDTEDNNIVGKINNCCSEFIIEKETLPDTVRIAGNVSKMYPDWDSPVKEITMYNITADI